MQSLDLFILFDSFAPTSDKNRVPATQNNTTSVLRNSGLFPATRDFRNA